MSTRRQTPCVARLALSLLAIPMLSAACSAHHSPRGLRGDTSLETVYVLRSTRDPQLTGALGCAANRTGFAPYAADAERHYSFWSVQTDVGDGRVVNSAAQKVAILRGCFGATDDRVRQNFHADITLGTLHFSGQGECVALDLDTPEPGLTSVRCHLRLGALPAPYVGGLLTTNTLTSRASFGGASDPAGYTQASIATLRLWRQR